MSFRLLRGPVPHVIETFTFAESADGTRLTYTGGARTDLWRLGQAWGHLVAVSWVQPVRDSLAAVSWVQPVRDSLAAVKTGSERRAAG